MPAHLMELPRRVAVGSGIIPEIGEIIHDLGIGFGCLIISGPNVRNVLGQELPLLLKRDGYKPSWEVIKDSTFSETERITDLAKKKDASFLIGVGGGKSIDVAKLASFNAKMPFISIPTSASHDGVSSPFASVKGLDRPYSVVARPPVAVIADIEIIARASRKLLVSGCGDLVSKKTAVKDWELAFEKKKEYFGRYSASLALLSADLVLDNASLISEGKLESVRVVVEALISAGVSAGIAGSSRPCSGSEHLFSHAMDIVAPGKGMHGEKCGMGTIMMSRLYEMEDSRLIKDSLKLMGAPVTAREIGATESEIVKSLVLAGSLRKERYTILDEAKLDESSARKLALESGVI